MATAFSDQFFRPFPGLLLPSRRRNLSTSSVISLPPFRRSTKNGFLSTGVGRSSWAVRLSLLRQSPQSSSLNVDGLIDFLYQDLPHLFDDQGIDSSMYDERVIFRDPITKHDSIRGYLFNIALLKLLFRPDFQLHYVKQTGPYEVTTRWTMAMKFLLLPWKPEVVFTGLSVMGINPVTQKFCSHVDLWDSIQHNEYFSLEGLLDFLKQLRIYKTPDLETPRYQILKRTGKYEVRNYTSFVVVETKGDKLSGSSGFNDVAGYIFGKNASKEKIPMTTPVFTQALDAKLSNVSIQIVLPSEKEISNLPDPNEEGVKLRQVMGGIAASLKFSGRPTEEIVLQRERELRSTLVRDGLKPKEGCLLARYNDPGRTWSYLMGALFMGVEVAKCQPHGWSLGACFYSHGLRIAKFVRDVVSSQSTGQVSS